MPLEADFQTEVMNHLFQFEGAVPHLYLDTVGKVTVGIGHMIPLRAAVTRVDLRRPSVPPIKPGQPAGEADVRATDEEKLAEYDAVAAMHKGLLWPNYTPATKLRMTKSGMWTLLEVRYREFLGYLRADYTKAKGYPADYDDLPKAVRLALFDMMFNMGRAGPTKKFPNFDKAVRAGDWRTAARECHRRGIGEARNKNVFDLFMSAAAQAPGASAHPGGVNVPSGVLRPGPRLPASR